MRTYDEVLADARPGSPFSNMTMFEMWAPRWCWAPCAHDDDETEKYCPILSVAVTGVTPQEWLTLDHVHGDYACTEFQAAPDPDDADVLQMPGLPPPELPGQLDLFGEAA